MRFYKRSMGNYLGVQLLLMSTSYCAGASACLGLGNRSIPDMGLLYSHEPTPEAKAIIEDNAKYESLTEASMTYMVIHIPIRKKLKNHLMTIIF